MERLENQRKQSGSGAEYWFIAPGLGTEQHLLKWVCKSLRRVQRGTISITKYGQLNDQKVQRWSCLPFWVTAEPKCNAVGLNDFCDCHYVWVNGSVQWLWIILDLSLSLRRSSCGHAMWFKMHLHFLTFYLVFSQHPDSKCELVLQALNHPVVCLNKPICCRILRFENPFILHRDASERVSGGTGQVAKLRVIGSTHHIHWH